MSCGVTDRVEGGGRQSEISASSPEALGDLRFLPFLSSAALPAVPSHVRFSRRPAPGLPPPAVHVRRLHGRPPAVLHLRRSVPSAGRPPDPLLLLQRVPPRTRGQGDAAGVRVPAVCADIYEEED